MAKETFTDNKRVKDLIRLMADNDLTEIELVEDKAKIRLMRDLAPDGGGTAPPPPHHRRFDRLRPPPRRPRMKTLSRSNPPWSALSTARPIPNPILM